MSGSPAEVEASTAQAHGPHCEVVGAPLTLHTTAGAESQIFVHCAWLIKQFCCSCCMEAAA